MPPSWRVCRGGVSFQSPTVSPLRTFLFSSFSCVGCQRRRNARSLRRYFSSGSASSTFSPQRCFGRSWLMFSHQSKANDFLYLLPSVPRLEGLLVALSRVRSPESSAPACFCLLQRSCWRLPRSVSADFPPIFERMTSRVKNQSAGNSGKARRTLLDLPICLASPRFLSSTRSRTRGHIFNNLT